MDNIKPGQIWTRKPIRPISSDDNVVNKILILSFTSNELDVECLYFYKEKEQEKVEMVEMRKWNVSIGLIKYYYRLLVDNK